VGHREVPAHLLVALDTPGGLVEPPAALQLGRGVEAPAEQGNGDAIQFARFLKPARARCKKLILVCTEPLRTLLRTVEGVDEVRLPGTLPVDLFDVYCPIMSLAGVLGITLDNLPAHTPYISIPKEVVVPTLPDHGKPKIGLVWKGSPTHATDHHRSCPPQTLFGLADKIDADFYSLQLPVSKEEKALMEKHGITIWNRN